MHVLQEQETIPFSHGAVQGKMFPTFGLTAEAQFSIVTTETGLGMTLVEHDTDVVYYIMEGDGQFIIDDVAEECHPGNLVVVPMGSRFTYNGRLKMLEICAPPWEEEQEEAVR